MADILDDKPVFIIVMGCNGCGKTTWKRANRDILTPVYIDFDSIAEGVGSWDSERSREEALFIGERRLQRALSERVSYGVESTYSGERGVNQVIEAKDNDYRIQGYYLATQSPDINIARIKKRVTERTGHHLDPDQIPNRWEWSLSNLRKTVDLFDELTIFDNSAEYDFGYQNPPTLAFFERGRVSRMPRHESVPDWFKEWFVQWERRQKALERVAEKQEKTRKRGVER